MVRCHIDFPITRYTKRNKFAVKPNMLQGIAEADKSVYMVYPLRHDTKPLLRLRITFASELNVFKFVNCKIYGDAFIE